MSTRSQLTKDLNGKFCIQYFKVDQNFLFTVPFEGSVNIGDKFNFAIMFMFVNR